jgi:putative thioredoxin
MTLPIKPAAPPPAEAVVEAKASTFAAEVIQASMKLPVVVDFWAPWCGPCKQLGPILEKAVRAAQGKVRLVKFNIDEPANQPLAQQLRVQSIPMVYAFVNGQPVDGFVGALPESQVKRFIARLAGEGRAPDPAEDLVQQGLNALDTGQHDAALKAFATALKHRPDHAGARAGLARAYLAKGDFGRARQTLAAVPAEAANAPEVKAAASALDLAEEAAKAGSSAEMEQRVRYEPDDHQARYDLALALLAQGARQRVVDELLEIVRRDRNWNDEAARKQLLKLFEAFGPTDSLTVEGRKRLSSLLFR